VSRKPPPRHSKPRRASSARNDDHTRADSNARHRTGKRSPVSTALRSRPARAGAVAAVAAAVIAVPALELVHWSAPASGPSPLDQDAGVAIGSRDTGHGPLATATPSAAQSVAPHRQPPRPTPAPTTAAPSTQPPASAAVYRNPLRDVSDLVLERVDMGVDFGGAGPVYALGDGVVTSASSDAGGWPGGGWITYQLTDGPASGLEVYVAEDVTPTVSVGQQVTPSTVIADMFNGGDGIETGWAQPGGTSAESQLPAAGGISGGGPFPTEVGLDFDGLLEALGVPAAPNAGQPGNGLLPSGYPTDWTSIESKG
jgi:murein DD-endopeptidase MepM/ murein hydrolase activator NlpD